MPALLKELMRHANIETTLVFYVGQNAKATADELWRVTSGQPRLRASQAPF
jgi:hypothetical protein